MFCCGEMFKEEMWVDDDKEEMWVDDDKEE